MVGRSVTDLRPVTATKAGAKTAVKEEGRVEDRIEGSQKREREGGAEEEDRRRKLFRLLFLIFGTTKNGRSACLYSMKGWGDVRTVQSQISAPER